MIGLAVAALVCVALSRERSLASGWLPAAVMAAGMVAIAVPAVPPLTTVVCAAALLAGGILAARGRDRKMAVHRALSSVAMAVLILIHEGHAMSMAGAPSAGHSQHAVESGPLLVAMSTSVSLAVAVTAVALAAAHARRCSAATWRGAAQLGEAGAMTAAVAWMLLA